MTRKLILAAMLVAVPVISSAQMFSTSFETAQGYTGGGGTNLAGQQGWTAGTGASATAFRVFTAAPVAFTGSNGVLANYSGTGSDVSSVGKSIGSITSGPISITSKMWIDPNFFQANRIFGIFMNSSASLSGTSFHGLGIDGAGNLRAATNYSDFWGTGGVRSTRSFGDVTNRWLTLNMTYNPTAASNGVTYTISGMGGTSTFAFTASRGGTAVINTVGMASDWVAQSNYQGQAAFDDFSVQAVPEPATMAALALGLGMVARRRRSKK
ncbi:MAG TPA: PEP-CTERM sorting domain-containing protein [Fimbriimonadaceae bacterium]|nr:PEP-CTERM sorting domain-containing protein [Fimbriimonadaceae bacterium]